jgi:hypothetical protein
MTLPQFTDSGCLPAGDYELTIEQLRSSMLVVGPDGVVDWDVDWRRKLTDNLEVLADQLGRVGITEIFVNGSFVEDKAHPNDIDGYFDCDLTDLASGKLERELNLLDPHKVWTWEPGSRRPYPGYAKKQLPMWHIYRVELYPHYGQPSGIVDEFGNELEFPSAFRRSRRDNKQKGIIKLGR